MFKETRPHVKETEDNQYRVRHGSKVPENGINLAYTYVSPISSQENVRVMDLSDFILENSFIRDAVDIFHTSESGMLVNQNNQADVYTQSVQLTHAFEEDVPLFYMYELKHMVYSKEKPVPYDYPKIKSILVLDRDGKEVKQPLRYRMQLTKTKHDNLYKVRIYTNFERKPGDDYKVLYSSVEIDSNGSYKTRPGTTESLNPRPAFNLQNDMDLQDLEYYLTPSMEFGYNRIYVSDASYWDDEYRTPIPFYYRLKATDEDTGLVSYTPWIFDTILNPKSVVARDEEYINGWKTLFDGDIPQLVMERYEQSWLHKPSIKYKVETNHPKVIASTESKGDRLMKANYTGTDDTGKIYFPPKFHVVKEGKSELMEVDFYLKHKTLDATIPVKVMTNHIKGTDHSALHETSYYAVNPHDFVIPSGIVQSEWDLVIETESDIEWWIEKNAIIQEESFHEPKKIVLDLESVYDVIHYLGYRYTAKSYKYSRQYAVYLQDEKAVRVLEPLSGQDHDQWYTRIQNGKFQKRIYNESTKQDEMYLYSIPEYYRQWFDEEFGLPVRKIIEEVPKVVGDKKIRVRHSPLYVKLDENNLPNIKIFALIEPEHEDMTPAQIQKNRIPLSIRAWDTSNGIIELHDGVKENDLLLVSYYYEEYTYTYRGYWDEDNQRYWHLDLNPSHGHKVTIHDKTNDEIREESSYWLINQTVYMYVKPVGKLQDREQIVGEELELVGEGTEISGQKYYIYESNKDVSLTDAHRLYDPSDNSDIDFTPMGTFKTKQFKVYSLLPEVFYIDYTHKFMFYRLMPRTFKGESVFHTFEPLSEREMRENNYLLLGKIQVRPNSKVDNLQIYDTRSRGGGIKENIQEALIKELCPEAKFYWDIGYWDGEPYPENAVLVIRLPKYILKGHGGTFTNDDVHKAVQKHIALGVFYLLEFIDESPEWLDTPINLEGSVVTLPDDTIDLDKPDFRLSVQEVECYAKKD